MNPLINTQRNPFGDVSMQTQEVETYSYSGIGLVTFCFFFFISLVMLGYLLTKGWSLKALEAIFLILWLSVVGFSFVYWPKSLRCDTENLTVNYWVFPSKSLAYSKIFAVNIKSGRGIAVTIYQAHKKPFCLFMMDFIRDSKKLVKTIVERANLPFQQSNDHTGDALFTR